jgi:pimeloyl-ACP methyl ester carboxylesterase
MRADVEALRPLADDRDVWVYDQIGAGASSRLDDVAGYTAAERWTTWTPCGG